jgi:hypothetical protein
MASRRPLVRALRKCRSACSSSVKHPEDARRAAAGRRLGAGVRALYDQMVQITLAPDWAKLLDFETHIPKAVEDLVEARQDADDGSSESAG